MDLITQLRRDEGVRYSAYLDTKGNPTTGVGHLILSDEDWLRTATLTDAQVDTLLAHDVAVNCRPLIQFSWYNGLDPVRQGAIQNMVFNLGITRLLGFPHMIAGLARHDWSIASSEMLNSDWKNEVGARAFRLAQQILTGVWQ